VNAPKDIPLLAEYFCGSIASVIGDLHGFDAGARQKMMEHPWPGNVRELTMWVERAVLMARENVVRVPDLGLQPDHGENARLEG